MEAKSIKETKEAVAGILEVAALLVATFKDGAQATDVVEVFNAITKNEELKAKLVASYNGANEIIDEVKDLSMAEGIELAIATIPQVIKIAQSFGK